MEVEIWNNDWELPTADFKCLQFLALLKFSGVTGIAVNVNRTNNPFYSPNGFLPVFKYRKEMMTEFKDVLAHLNSKNFCADLHLIEKQAADSLACRYMVEAKLYPALYYTWWMDAQNYEKVTRPWYSTAITFPFNFYYPAHYKKVYEDKIHSLYQHCNEVEAEYVTEIFREAEKCLACLSNRLGENKFFFGCNPSSLDAFVYGCLAPLVKAPLPSNVLQNYVKASRNLLDYVNRIGKHYFSKELSEYNEKKEKEKKKSTKISESLPHKKRNQIIAAVFAVGVSLIYGFITGIFAITTSHEDLEDIDDTDDHEN